MGFPRFVRFDVPSLVVALLLPFAAMACSSKTSSDACEQVGPQTCPADAGAVPSYDAAIAAIVEKNCTPCHAPGGVESNLLLVNYGGNNGLAANHLAAIGQLDACLMPQTGTISESDKVALLTWLVCGAPDN